MLLAPGEGETAVDRAERTLRILVETEQVIVTWFRYEPGEEGPEPHVHHHHTDAFYVLEGEVEFGLGPEVKRFTGAAGTYAAAPPDVVHTFRNSSDATAIFLNIHAPSMGFGDVIRGRGREGFDQHDPPPDGGRPLEDAIYTGPGEDQLFQRDYGTNLIKGALEQVSVFELTCNPDWEGIDPHSHDDHLDSFFVLDGEAALVAGTETHRSGPGSFLSAPIGARHGCEGNTGSGSLRLLNIHAPDAGFAGRIRGQ